MQLPSYFGHNWDALDECLCDRDFEPRAATALIVEHCEHLLQRARQGRRRILFQILNRVAAGRQESNYWEPDDPYEPFWVVLNFAAGVAVDWITAEAPRIVIVK